MAKKRKQPPETPTARRLRLKRRRAAKKAAATRAAKRVEALGKRTAARLRKASLEDAKLRKAAERQRLESLREERRRSAELNHDAIYANACAIAIKRGDLENLLRALINEAITVGDIDDNVLNESVGMLHWVLRQVRAKREARNLRTGTLPVLPRRIQDARFADVDMEEEDVENDEMSIDEGIQRHILGDRSFP